VKGILSAISFNSKTETHINTEEYIETIGEVPVTSIVVNFEYYETDVGHTNRFRVIEDIKKDSKGTWSWLALNLDTNKNTPIICMQQGKAYWPKIVAA